MRAPVFDLDDTLVLDTKCSPGCKRDDLDEYSFPVSKLTIGSILVVIGGTLVANA
jgi:hypothetical protein